MNFKLLMLCITCLGISYNSSSQFSITGIITDAEIHQPINNVSIYLPDLKTGTNSHANGAYNINKLKAGHYLLEISHVGYKTIIREIIVKADTAINFSLQVQVSELNEVIVTGVGRSTEIKLNPIVIKTIDKQSLIQNTSTNLIDGLKNIPGISQITTGAAISKPIIRGLGYNRVITLNNGIRQEGQQWGDEHGIEIDEYGVDRVEIVKGPGSLMYGSDGIAGVLNFLPAKPLNNGQVNTQVTTNYQSNNNLLGYSVYNAGNKNGIQWQGRWSNKFASNYQNAYDGKVLNSGFKEYDGSLMLGVNKSWGHSYITVSSFNQILNLPEGERDSLGKFTYVNAAGNTVTATDKDYDGYTTGFPHQSINHFRVTSNNYFVLKHGTIQADVAFQQNKRKEFGNATQPNNIDLYFDLQTLNYNVRYNFNKKQGWETSIGVGGMQQSNRNKGIEFLIPAYNLFDAGAYIITQKTIRKLTIAGGLRFDNRWIEGKPLYLDSLGIPTSSSNAFTTTKFSGFNNSFSGISGSIGISYQINPSSTVKLNVSRGFRAPNMAELTSNGRHEGTFRYEIGNRNLSSEMSHQIDVAYFLNSQHVTLEVTPFVNLISNYVFAEKLKAYNGNDSIVDPSDPAPAIKFNSGNAMLVGGEIYVDIHPHPLDWLHIENSFSYVQATQQNQPDSTRYLPFIPAPKYRGEIKAQFKQVGKTISNVYLKFGLDYFFAQNNIFSAFGTETATPAYTLLNTGLGASIKAFKQNNFMSLLISAENLANVAYQNHLSRLKYAPENMATGRVGIFNMGRNISVKLLFNF